MTSIGLLCLHFLLLQLDVSIMAYDEKELVYNLYPLQVGWQELPVLTLEYNTKADPQKNDSQNALLDELVQRALPKRVFVLVSGRCQEMDRICFYS